MNDAQRAVLTDDELAFGERIAEQDLFYGTDTKIVSGLLAALADERIARAKAEREAGVICEDNKLLWKRIADWRISIIATVMAADGGSDDQTPERLPVLVAKRIDAAVQRVAALEAENARLVVIVQRAIQWADWKRGGVPGAGRTWDAREADLIAALAPPAIAP